MMNAHTYMIEVFDADNTWIGTFTAEAPASYDERLDDIANGDLFSEAYEMLEHMVKAWAISENEPSAHHARTVENAADDEILIEL